MEKKQYVFPVVDVALLRMKELMKAAGSSPYLPPQPGAAPRRRTDVF